MKYQGLPKRSFQSSACRIGYRNLLESGTVTASSENAAYPVANAFDWLMSDYFRPMAAGTVNIDLTLTRGLPASYFAFYGQDLWRYGGSLKLQYHNGLTFVDCTPNVIPANNAPRMFFFDSLTSTRWRVVVNCTAVFNLGCIAFGEHLGLPRGMYMGWTPPLLGRANEMINSISDAGSFLGRSIISRGVQTSLNLQQAPDEFARRHWLPFMRHAEAKPFFFAPNIAKYPTEAAFCWAESGVGVPTHSAYGFMSGGMTIRGVVE